MSRLYLKAHSDARKTEITARGHERIEATIYWGSASDSKEAASILVSWPKGRNKPIITVNVSEDAADFGGTFDSSRVYLGNKKIA